MYFDCQSLDVFSLAKKLGKQVIICAECRLIFKITIKYSTTSCQLLLSKHFNVQINFNTTSHTTINKNILLISNKTPVVK